MAYAHLLRVPPMSSAFLRFFVFVLLLCAGGLLYLPGLGGPYLYDDYSNLLDNRYLQIESLNTSSLRQAAFSIDSGPLQRPIAMASFAVNAYLAGGFASPAPFRLTNIAIHLLNGALVYWLLRLIIERQRTVFHRQVRRGIAKVDGVNYWLAAILAFLWLLHPINLTSVLYVIQRMTSLAALFTLLALLGYLLGRLRIQTGQRNGGWIIAGSLGVFGTLGVLCKENTLLLPLFILILDFTLFRTERPWTYWPRLSRRTKLVCVAGAVALAIVLLAVAAFYASGGYANKPFTMTERLLTESRVLVLYLSLIVAPRLNAFGMYHDDIDVSRSLLEPATTILAIVVLAGLIAIAVRSFRKAPLVTLGIAWFITGHLLESTIFPLEIAHEHRNYLASLGLPIVLIGITQPLSHKLGERGWFSILIAIAACFAVVTYMRASQWSSHETFYVTEVRHHPNSADANASLGYLLMNRGRFKQGAEILRRAADLKPYEPGPLINLIAFSAMRAAAFEKQDLDTIDAKLAKFPITATTQRALVFAADCVLESCRPVAPQLERWLRLILVKDTTNSGFSPIYHYFLGRALIAQGKHNESINAYRTAYELDPAYIIPLFDIAQIYIQTGRLNYAQIIADEIRRVNQIVSLPRERELLLLEKVIENAKRNSKE